MISRLQYINSYFFFCVLWSFFDWPLTINKHIKGEPMRLWRHGMMRLWRHGMMRLWRHGRCRFVYGVTADADASMASRLTCI